MNDQIDIGRVLDRWLGDDTSAMPERVAIVVADRIERQPQRRPWRLSWRLNDVKGLLALGSLLGLLIVVALAGRNLPSVAGPNVTAAPSTGRPSPTATAAPTPMPPMLQEGPLQPRTYLVRSIVTDPSFLLSVDAPMGWSGSWGFALAGPRGDGPPDGVMVAFDQASGLNSDPCHWDRKGDLAEDQPADIAVGPSVDDLVTALRSDPAVASSPASDVTVGGFAGRQLTIEIPSGIQPSTCDGGRYQLWTSPAGDSVLAAAPGGRWHLRIVEAAGRRMIVATIDYPGTPDADRAAAQAIVDSIHFEP